MREQLTELRDIMRREGIDWYIVPSSDFHNSEYVHDYFKCRKYITGFTGSAGTAVIGGKEAWLWTDGRYFLQAAEELKDSGFGLMKQGQPGVPSIVEYLKQQIQEADIAEGGRPLRIGFDGRVFTAAQAEELMKLADTSEKKVEIVWDQDLVDEIWYNRPVILPTAPKELPIQVTGRSTEQKLKDIRRAMSSKEADWLVLTDLSEIAWTWNSRGRDIECTPVFYGYGLISQKDARRFIMSDSSYEKFFDALRGIPAGSSVWIDRSSASLAVFETLGKDVKVIDEPTPVGLLKAVKNRTELQNFRYAHIKDGIAMVNFIYWLKSRIGSEHITEMSAAEYLDNQRRNQEGCFDLSFPTIAGYGPHGAIVHYEASMDTNAVLKPEGFLLVDSGGQYRDGTTDITRTIALGPLTDKMKEYYTLVLKAHIALSSCRFQPGTTGSDLDAVTRKPLKDRGLDYNHGTGHGIGYILSVHEGPNIINPRNELAYEPGMVTSDEPGVYIENEFGIRLENVLVCEVQGDQYGFRPLTYCPFDRDAIIKDMLTESELAWLNDYHKTVFSELRSHLAPEVRRWLEEATAEL